MDNTQRFSNRVDNYALYRPDYPAAVLTFLRLQTGLTPGWIVADIGSGTGISTALFLENGNTVCGVEPNQPMRLKAEELLADHPNFISVDGTAEHTGLENGSIDLIVASQAFHWFDPAGARAEFDRIAKPGAWIALIWNERLVRSSFEQAYEELLLEYGTDYTKVRHNNIRDEDIARFFAPAAMITASIDNGQDFSWERLKGRLLSSSYIPAEQDERYERMLDTLRSIFDRYNDQGLVRFDYQTRVYLAPTDTA